MSLVQKIREEGASAISGIYGLSVVADDILVNQTKVEFEGDYTIVLFGLVKQLKMAPEKLGKEIGEYLTSHNSLFTGFNVIKGFLNLTISDSWFAGFLQSRYNQSGLASP